MRQAIIIVPLFVLLLTILYIFTPLSPDQSTYESFISGDAQIVICQYDLEQRISELSDSPLGQTIKNLHYGLIGSELNFTEAEIEQFLRLKQQLEESYKNPLVKVLIGSEVSVALLPFEPEEGISIEDQILNHLLIVSRPKHGTRLMDFATWINSNDQAMSKSRYGRHHITRFELEDDRRLGVVRVKELLIMSLNEQVMRQSLDIYDNNHGGLLENQGYLQKIDQFKDASIVGYVNFNGLPEFVNKMVQASLAAGEAVQMIDPKQVNGYDSAVFGAWREESAIMDKAVISFDPESMNERSQSIISRQPERPGSFTKVAGDTIIYHWSNQFNAETLVNTLAPEGTPAGGIDDGFIDQLAEITGLTSEQLFNLFDNDMTLAVRRIEEDQLVPLPRFLVSLKSSDIGMLKTAINKLIEYYSIPVRRKKLEKNEIITWGGIVGIGSVLPALSFIENEFIISSNRAQVKGYIDNDREDNLAGNKTFQQMGTTILQPANSITYVDFAQTTEMVEEMVSWGGTMIAIKDRELAKKSKVLIDELINPLLEGLSMYSTIGSRKYIDGQTIVFESRTNLEHGNKQP